MILLVPFCQALYFESDSWKKCFIFIEFIILFKFNTFQFFTFSFGKTMLSCHFIFLSNAFGYISGYIVVLTVRKICCCFLFISFKLVCFQGCCIGQGTYSDLANSGLDVQSLVSLPESDDDSDVEADDIEVKEKEGGNTTQANAVKAKVRNFIIVCQPLLIIHM